VILEVQLRQIVVRWSLSWMWRKWAAGIKSHLTPLHWDR